jgi:hypothetical protein
MNGKPDLAEGFTLRCLQRLSRPYVGYPAMLLAEQLAHQRYVPPNPLVLGRKPRKFPAPTADRDRPVSRRSKPSSRTAFIGEQPNPWELLHPQDAMSRHRTIFHDFAWRRLYHHLVSDFSSFGNPACAAIQRNMVSIWSRKDESRRVAPSSSLKPSLSGQSLRGL